MSQYRINVKSNEMWGRLVKSWATGRDYVGHTPTVAAPVPPEPAAGTAPKNPKPTSFADFVNQCRLAQVGLFFEDGSAQGIPITGNEDMGFVLLQVTSDTAVLRLPAKEKIHESEEKLIGKPAADGVPAVAPKTTRYRSSTPMSSAQAWRSRTRRKRWCCTPNASASTRSTPACEPDASPAAEHEYPRQERLRSPFRRAVAPSRL